MAKELNELTVPRLKIRLRAAIDEFDSADALQKAELRATLGELARTTAKKY